MPNFVKLVVAIAYLGAVAYAQGHLSFRLPTQRCMSPPGIRSCCGDLVANVKASSPESTTPRVLIGIGVQKGATSFMAYLLSRHPGFLSPVKKELEYFNDDSRSVYSLEDYLSNWKWNRELDQNRMLYEFTPDYLPSAFAACRMKSILPNAKLLVILRNPVDRFYSHVNMERHFCKDKALEEKFGVIHEQVCGGNASALLPTSSLLEAHLDHAKSIGCTFVNGNTSNTWMDCQRQSSKFQMDRVARGYYAAQLAWWMEFYSPDNIMILDSNEVTEDAAGILEKVAIFALGQEAAAGYQRPIINLCVRNPFRYEPEVDLSEALDFLSKQYRTPNEELQALLATVYPSDSHSYPLDLGYSLSHSINWSEHPKQTLLAHILQLGPLAYVINFFQCSIVWKIWKGRVVLSLCVLVFLILRVVIHSRKQQLLRSGIKQL